MKQSMAQSRADIINSHPLPGATPVEHLRHTVSVCHEWADHDMAVRATSGIYGEGETTGVTYGDLRALPAMIDKEN